MKKILQRFFHFVFGLKTSFYIHCNRLIFRLKGVSFEQGLKVYNKIYIQPRGTIKIGRNFLFTSGDCINPICRNIRGCIYSEPGSVLEIGNHVSISSACIWIKERVSIGNNVNIGGNVLIMDNDAHELNYVARRGNKKTNSDIEYTVQHSPIIIEDDVWIGANCQILKGVTIGARTIIGAGSVVTRNIPADCIAAGNPCRIIRRNG